ncbi:MAG: glycoside hydrolase family 88 protein [Sphingomonas sp.]|uniref:glycoside hydrolase family 88 protein n=1 Tax=Sphingomonas sp. TaxID=28214 RepID=UPI001B1E80F1|nr:glycoside hydrolase family 88 protein [Sphingomonas sp.]MBO9623583.1 glycoside hydrolase family 88 protein [Sphingomonas sp.]
MNLLPNGRSSRLLPLLLAGAALGLPAAALAQAPVVVQGPVAGIDPVWLTPTPRPALSTDPKHLPTRAEALAAAEYVSSAQIASMARKPIPAANGGVLDHISANWVSAAFYVGAARLARVSDDPRTLRFLTMVADHFNYSLRGARSGKTMLNADDIAIGDLYEELYSRRQQEGVLMPLRQRLDWQVPHLARAEDTPALIWWWCDALFMAPPVLARMSAITGDPKYLIAADKEWRRTAERLWVPGDRLFLRDARFAGRTEANGKPIYWARGNGWVMGGLARLLESMPADFAGRSFYVDTFRTMAPRIAELQRPNGLWATSLLAPETYPEPETSGSAFFVYALAWGINHGLLDRKTYLPHVLRGWAGLNRQVLPSGMLGAAQKTGDQPVHTEPQETGPYASGAYVLAALEIADLSAPAKALPHAEPAPDAPARIAATTPVPPPPPTVVGPQEVARRAQEMRATESLSYDPSTLARPSAIEKIAPPTEEQRRPRAVARFAPDRLDDMLWENDRVAHRIYGPALEAKEPPSGSGIDVWAKRVRWPFMDRQLKFPNYHVDRGEGLDFYDVGRSRGAGGLGIWYDNKLWTSRNYAEHKVLETGGDTARFSVTYKPWPVDVVRKVWEEREFALPMGSNFTRMRSTLSSDSKEPLIVGIGIGKVPVGAKGAITRDKEHGRMLYWQPTDPEHGELGIAVVADPAMVVGFAEDAENYLMLVRVEPGKPFTYYTGSAWSRGGDFANREAWEKHVTEQKFAF